ncbi:hypothetical protein Tco_0784307, partial [Tanacetum coccineum]
YGYIRNHKKTIKKTSKHEHENGRANKSRKSKPEKVKPQSNPVTYDTNGSNIDPMIVEVMDGLKDWRASARG